MAAFTSVQSGNWNDNATWGTGAGVYPGSTSSQADTAVIAATHDVTINVATVASGATVAVTVNAGAGGGAAGNLIIGAVMSAAWITTLQTDYTAGQERGHLTWLTGGTYTLMTGGTATLNGDFNMDASGAGSKLTWNFGNYAVTFGANSTITNLKGRTKTGYTQFNGTPTATAATVDDVTGWDVGDYIAYARNATNRARVATTNDPVSTSLTYGSTAQMANAQDNGRCINLTRSAVLIGAGTTAKLTFTAGMTITNLQYVEWQDCSFSFAVAGDPALFTGCSWYATGNSRCDNTFSASLRISDTVAYAGGAIGLFKTTASGRAQLVLTRCYALLTSTNNYVAATDSAAGSGRVELISCECSVGRLIQTGVQTQAASVGYMKGCYSWGAANPAVNAQVGVFYLLNCVFGLDAGGNVNANVADINVASSCGQVFLDNCALTSGVVPAVGTDNVDPRVVSVNNGQASGARVEWQRYGTATKTADTDFTSDVCDEIDPSSATYPFRYTICFPCAVDQTPTLTFNHKRTGGPGACTVTLGYQTAGLTGIATGGTITLSDTVAEHTVTFSGTSSLGGMVEVIVEVLDGDGSDTLRIGDIAVTGNK